MTSPCCICLVQHRFSVLEHQTGISILVSSLPRTKIVTMIGGVQMENLKSERIQAMVIGLEPESKSISITGTVFD